MTTAKRYETRDELFARTKIPVRTWEKWATTGDGPPMIKLNRKVLYDSDVVDAWLGQRTVRSTSDAGAA